MNPRFRHFLAGGLLALVVPACGENQHDFRFPVHPTAGRVLHEGKPVCKAFVQFHPTDPSMVAMPEGQEGLPVLLTTETDEAGRFAMSTYHAGDGVPVGDYAVTVAVDLAESDVENSDFGPRTRLHRERLFGKVYRDPATTPLRATVKSGENHFKFELD